jgi:hypothetical protein
MIAQILCGRIGNGAVDIPSLEGLRFFTASVGVRLGPQRSDLDAVGFRIGAEKALLRAKAAGGNLS